MKNISINQEFNKDFQAIYSIFLQVEAASVIFNQTKDKSNSSEREAHTKTIMNFSKAFQAFGKKYKFHSQEATFTPESLAMIPPNKLCGAVMNDLISVTYTATEVEALCNLLSSK